MLNYSVKCQHLFKVLKIDNHQIVAVEVYDSDSDGNEETEENRKKKKVMLFDYSEYLKELSCFLRLPQTDIKINSFIFSVGELPRKTTVAAIHPKTTTRQKQSAIFKQILFSYLFIFFCNVLDLSKN